MQNRHLLAITIAVLSAASQSGTANADWSPLQKDVAQEVGSSEKAAELSHFHKMREQVTAQEKAEREAAKKQKGGLLGMLKKPKNSETATVPQAPAEPEEETTEAVVPAGEEPGTAPSKELMESSAEEDSDKTSEEDSEDSDAPKKAKAVPGQHPTEDTNDSNYFVKRAQSYANQKDFQSALNYIDRALELQPQNWDAWYTKALVYQLAGYDAAAARRYLKLLERRPDMLEAHIGIAMLYRKHSNYDLAQKEYEEAIALKYFSFPAHYNLANLLMDQKKYEQALKEYKVCLKLSPNNALVHNNMGVIFQNRNYLEEAADEFKRASNLDPANKMFLANLNAVKVLLSKKTTGKTRTM
jgi:tetratricopeptide (TPR) repeat protein